MAEVRLERVTKRIGRQTIIDDLSLTVHNGEVFALVGPSGSGKSTLLHLIAGLERPTSGRVLFDGQDVTAYEPRARDVALVFQSYALYPHMTVAENLAFPLRVGPSRPTRSEIDGEVRRVADMLELAPLLARRPRELSGGQRQRVALGRALIRRPRVFLLDEPLSNLDAQLRAGMRAELRRLHDTLNVTMIYVTHDQTEALTLADHLAVLDHGRLQQTGTPDELYEQPANVMVASFVGHPAMNLWEAAAERGIAVAGALRIPVHVEDAVNGVVHVRLGIRPEDVRIAPEAEGARTPRPGATIGTARLVERTGSQTWVTVELTPVRPADSRYQEGRQFIIGLAEGKRPVHPGASVMVWLDRIRPYVFDADRGARLPTRAGVMAGTGAS